MSNKIVNLFLTSPTLYAFQHVETTAVIGTRPCVPLFLECTHIE